MGKMNLSQLQEEIAELEQLLAAKKNIFEEMLKSETSLEPESGIVSELVNSLHDASSEINNNSSPEDKITLFRSMFRGREDVYAKRFESKKTGKSGYQPVCRNEWVKGICEKPKVKCDKCP